MRIRTLSPRDYLVLAAVTAAFVLPQTAVRAQETSEQLFTTHCATCHTIGKGRLIGPDLQGVTFRYTREWLLEYIPSSQTMIKKGDPQAVAVYNYYKQVIMPDPPLSAAQIVGIVDYLDALAGGGPEESDEEGDPDLGLKMFQGTVRLQNGGPTCTSCHDVRNDAVIGGGLLAKDLTSAFSRLGGDLAVRAILGSQPFPVMERAYRDRPLELDEVAHLIAFLQKADADQQLQQPKDYGVMLLLSGVGGLAVLFVLYGFIWRGRKTSYVNAAIYDRQIAST